MKLANIEKYVPAVIYSRWLNYFERGLEELKFMYPKRKALLDELSKV